MANLHIQKSENFLVLKRLINTLIKKDELTSKKIDDLLQIGTARGFSNRIVEETVMDCQIDFRVD